MSNGNNNVTGLGIIILAIGILAGGWWVARYVFGAVCAILWFLFDGFFSAYGFFSLIAMGGTLAVLVGICMILQGIDNGR